MLHDHSKVPATCLCRRALALGLEHLGIQCVTHQQADCWREGTKSRACLQLVTHLILLESCQVFGSFC